MHHAFRGEVWDKAVAHLRSVKELPTFDGYGWVGFVGEENTGHLWWVGDHEHAIRTAQRDIGASAALGTYHMGGFALLITTHYRVAQAHHSLGEYARAITILRKNIELLSGELLHERCDLSGLPSVFSRAWLAMCLAERGEFGDAIAAGEEALQIAEAGDPGYSLVVASAGLGNVCLIKGEFERAVAVLERGFPRESNETIDRVWPFAASALGAAYTAVRRTDEALPLLEQAVERAVSMKLIANHPLRLGRLAEAHLVAGRPENAFPLAAQALDLAREHRERGHEAYILRLLGEIWISRETPDLDRADECYRKALALAQQLGMRPLEGQCHVGLSRLNHRSGQLEAATVEASSACELFRGMGMTFWLRRAEAATRT